MKRYTSILERMPLISALLLFVAAPAFCSLSFEPNRGQTDPSVQYLARTQTGVVFLTSQGIVFHGEKSVPVQISFTGARPLRDWRGVDPTGQTINYMVGKDPKKWSSGLTTFRKVEIATVYPGIDLVLYGTDGNQLEYDLIVHPGADPSQIRIRSSVPAAIDPQSGDLVTGAIRQHRPVLFQGSRKIDGHFRKLNKHEFGFVIAAYDRAKPLTIDPVIESREYLGGTGDDTVTVVASNGDAAGTTTSIDFPGATAALRHGTDIFVRKGSITYIVGGSGDERAAIGHLNSASFVFVAGTTTSTDLPVDDSLLPQFREYQGGASDGIVVYFAGSQVRPAQVMYLGTDGEDRIEAFSNSDEANILLVGSSNGHTLPKARLTPFQATSGGGFDVFAAQLYLSSSTPELYLTTFLGGSGDDFGYGVDYSGGLLSGETNSPNFPLVNPIQSQRKGPTDGFLARIRYDSTLNGPVELQASTLFGGNGTDRINSVFYASDYLTQGSGLATAVGSTSSTDLPSTAQGFQSVYGGGSSDAFLASFDFPLTKTLRATYLGGSGADEGLTVLADSITGGVFAAGRTTSRNFPLRTPVQAFFGGGTTDGFLVYMRSDGTMLQSTYFGGSGDDEILTLALKFDRGSVLVAGSSTSTDLPGGPAFNPLDARRAGTKEGFIAQIATDVILFPERMVSAKYFQEDLQGTIGNVAKASAAGTIRIRSSDSSKVLVGLGFAGYDPPLPTETFGSTINTPLRVECLVDSGGATVTVSIPGYPDGSTNVTCVQPELRVGVYSFDNDSPELNTLWGGLWNVDAVPVAVDPVTGISRFLLSPSVVKPQLPRLSIGNSNPQIARVEDRFGNPATVFAWAIPVWANQLSFAVRPLAVGETTLSASMPGFKSASRVFRVIPPPTFDKAVSAGYSVRDVLSVATNGQPITIRSLDTSRILLTNAADYTSAGFASVTFNSGVEYQIRAAAGSPVGAEAQIEVSAPGLPSFRKTLRFVAPILDGPQCNSCSPSETELPVRMVVGAQKSFVFRLKTGRGYYDGLEDSPGQTQRLITISSSNPAVLAADGSLPLSTYTEFKVTATAPGSSTVRFTPPAGFALSSTLAAGIPIVVSPVATVLRFYDNASNRTVPGDFDLGKDLASERGVVLPFPIPGDTVAARTRTARITTTNPELIQLRSGSSVGPSIQATFDGIRPSFTFTVEGLAAQGEARVTCEVPGFAPITATVRLQPSGYAWRSPEVTIFAGFSGVQVGPSPAALDGTSGLPLVFQQLRAGVTPPTLTVTNSSPANIYYSEISGETYANGLVAGSMAILAFQQPAGFTSPPILQKMRVISINNNFKASTERNVVRVVIRGNGTITGCSTNPCTLQADSNGDVTLIPTAAVGYRFIGWKGYGCYGLGGCSLRAVNSFQEVVVTFEADTGGLHFVPITPCRIADTRNANGPLGGPSLAARATRNFNVAGACQMPANAAAYSLNVTVVPRGALGYVSIWPGGQTQPVVSTLNSLDGRVKANAAIIPAGARGSVDVFATDNTDVILDVNGVFVPAGSSEKGQSFYPLTPCRVLDTRVRSDGPLTPLTNRGVNVIFAGGCGVPQSAAATVLNVTAVPKQTLGYLTLWSGGSQPRPVVSTLNAVTGTVTANMAIVPTGFDRTISAFATEATDLVVDVLGYFAPPGDAGAMNFYPLTPCRLLDTRNADGPLGGPVQQALSARDYPVLSSACGVPPSARAYAVNATVVAPGLLGFLTLYPVGVGRPLASTLNAVDGSITSNAAIVPAGVNGAVTAFVTERTHLILDISGYFAP